MNKQYFYIGKEEALKHQSMVYAVSQEPIEFYKEILGENAVEFYTDNLPYYVAIDGDTVREATNLELYESGIYELLEGEFIHGDKILNVYDFEIPEGILKPAFNYDELRWEETATAEEIAEHAFRQSVSFYNSELDFASKATAELACEIISPEMYEDVKSYMKAIDPYAQPSRTRMELKINRPSIFDRYN